MDNFDQEYLKQTKYLACQIEALSRKPRRDRQKYQLLVVRCKRCGDVILEVLDLDPYPVVRTRDREGATLATPAPPPSDLRPIDRGRHLYEQMSSPQVRLDKRWRFVAFSIAEPRGGVTTACRCQDHGLIPLQWVADQCGSGVRATTR